MRAPMRGGRGGGGFSGGRGGGFSGGRDGGGRGGGRGRGGFSGGRGGEMSRGGGRSGGRGGGRGRGAGGRGGRGGGMKGGSKVVVEPHRHEGVFIAKGKEDALCTKNMVPGEAVYNEKRVSVQNEDGTKVEYRVWNPFRSKLAAAVLGGVDNIWMKPGSKVLYLGAASGTTVSHVSDLVGPTGCVYAVEFSHRSGRDLVNMAKKRTNVIPIIEDARHPAKYRMLVGMVDVIFSDVAQPDQVIGAVGFMNQRLEIPKDVDPQWASLINSCWSSEPKSRPTFQEILVKLKDFPRKLVVQTQVPRRVNSLQKGL